MGKECTYFVDFEWDYAINYATTQNTSFWPSASAAADFKANLEAMPYMPNPSEVDLDAWSALVEQVLPLCHGEAIRDLDLPSWSEDPHVAGWSKVPVPADPDCLS